MAIYIYIKQINCSYLQSNSRVELKRENRLCHSEETACLGVADDRQISPTHHLEFQSHPAESGWQVQYFLSDYLSSPFMAHMLKTYMIKMWAQILERQSLSRLFPLFYYSMGGTAYKYRTRRDLSNKEVVESNTISQCMAPR